MLILGRREGDTILIEGGIRIVVVSCDRGGVPDSVKVLDFGLVKHFGTKSDEPLPPEAAGEDGMVGTPNFIAPEAIKDSNQTDARSDLYSLGALGYFLLTGREVFESNSLAELCGKHLAEIPVSPAVRTGRHFNRQFESLLMQCLEKDPAQRPQSARELAHALSECPLVHPWTPERRSAWWTEHRKPVTGSTQLTPPGASPIDQTVKIEFADRTP